MKEKGELPNEEGAGGYGKMREVKKKERQKLRERKKKRRKR